MTFAGRLSGVSSLPVELPQQAGIVLLFSGWVRPSLLGYVFVAGQAAFVAGVVELECIGLRQSAPVHA